MNKSVAILLFSRTAYAEAQAKPLVLGKNKAERVAGIAIQQARKTALATGLPVFYVSEKQQRGNSFGERLSNAFNDIFSNGFESVIAIGNDCLDLSPKNLTFTAAKLTETPLVLGETLDGGVYILGLQRDIFHLLDFSKITWQSENVFKELTSAAEKLGISPLFLEKKADFDTPIDFIKILETVAFRLKKLFSAILKDTFPISFSFGCSMPNPLFLAAQSLRAP